MKKTNLDRLIKRVLSEKKLNLNEEKCYCSTDGSKVNISGCNPCTQECCKEAGYDEVWSGSAVRGGTKRGKGKGMRAKLQKEQFGAPDICDICMAHYAFSASKRHQYCTGPNGVCNGGPTPCELCKIVYPFSKKKRTECLEACTKSQHLGVDKYHSGPKEDMPQFGSMDKRRYNDDMKMDIREMEEMNEMDMKKCCKDKSLWYHKKCCKIALGPYGDFFPDGKHTTDGKKKTMTVSESSLINTIEKIVKEQAAMLGFGNMGGLSLGVSKPSDKYELDEDSQDTNTSNTYNINLMNQQAANQNMEDWEMGEDYELEEDAKPDYLDFDGDGNKKESMKKALKDKEMDEQCGDGVYEGGCGERVYENVGRLLRKNIKEVQRKQLRNWIKK